MVGVRAAQRFTIRSIVGLEALRDPGGSDEWSLVTRSVVVLFEQLTEPAVTA